MRKILLMMTAVLCAGYATAQDLQVTGVAIAADDGSPMPAVAVALQGTGKGTTTDLDGVYSITVPSNGTLVFSFMGYEDAVIPVNGRKVINVTLSPGTIEMDDVIITALGITKSEKSLGYSATELKTDELVAARANNVISSVAGKVAGVSVSSSATTAGGQQSVIIRGVSSIGNSNQPLYVVDGVPMQSITISNTYAGYGNMGIGIGSLNNDDIESMTILKGAAATALYGSRASNGVIIVTTKSGNNDKTEITVNAGTQFSNVSTLPEFQDKFCTGWDGNLTLDENGSWGPAGNGQLRVYGPIVNSSQLAKNYEAIPSNVRDFYDTGIQYNTSISMRGGNDKTGYFLSYSHTDDDGILPKDKDTYTKNTFSFRGNHQAYKWLKLESSVNMSKQQTNQVSQGVGQQSILEGLYQAGRDISFIDGEDLTSIFNRPEGWYTPYGITNPYWIIDNSYNRTDAKKVFGKIQTDITPMRQLTLSYRYGFDYTDYDNKVTMYQIAMDKSYSNSSSTNQEGSVTVSYGRYYEINNDFLANWNDSYGKFEVNATAGVNVCERASTTSGSTVNGLTFDTGFWDLSNTSNQPTSSESQSKRRNIGVFGDLQLGWDDQIYLDFTARNDWSSTLPVDKNSYFYPGATASWLFSNTFGFDDSSFGKIRVAYGKTGNDPSAYLTNMVLTQGYAAQYLADDISFPFNGYNAFQKTATLPSSSLQPEMTSEFEVGANLSFFDNRLGLDIAYYDRTSDMQIFTLPSDPATGYSRMVVNFGKVNNKGVELLLSTTPVRVGDFEWNLDFNWSKNNNKVVSLPDGLDGGRSQLVKYDDVVMYAEIGKPLGTLYTTMPIYNEEGKIVVGDDGLPSQGTEYEYTGYTVQNDWTGGINTTFRWKGISVGATLDVRWGGYMYSRTKTLLWFTGNSIENTYNDRKAFVVPNSVVLLVDGDDEPILDENGKKQYYENNTPITLYESTYQYYMNGNNSYPLEGGKCKLVDRTYAKLRDVTVSYTLPKRLLKKVHLNEVVLSAVGSNLYLWTPKSNCYIDPDQGYTTDLNGMFGEIDCTVPNRYFGFNAQIKF